MISGNQILMSFLTLLALVETSYSQIKKKQLVDSVPLTKMLSVGDGSFLPTMPDIVHPSPQSQALTRYGDYPVGFKTGIVDMSIPLHEIKTRSLNLPISIGFHASGRRKNEIDGTLGMRWTLNCGGLVTRTLKGRPDEWNRVTAYPFDPYRNPTFEELYSSCTEGFRNHIGKSYAPRYDSEYDVFKYVLPSGKHGSFILKNIDGVRKAMTFPYDALKIETVSDHTDEGLFSSIKITDVDGKIYIFGSEFILNSNFIEISNNSETGSLPSAWYLREIISANLTDKISFEYIKHRVSIHNYSELVTTADRVRDCSTNANFHYNDYTGPALMDMLLLMPEEEQQISEHDSHILPIVSAINYEGGTMSFEYISVPNSLAKLLKEIDISGNYTRKIKFNTTKGQTDYLHYLKSVEMTSENLGFDKIEQVHRFEYYEPQTLSDVQSLYGVDWWGYYTRINHSPNFIYLVPQQTIIYQVPRQGTVEARAKSIGVGVSREPDVDAQKFGMLKSIEYPTGGKTEFDYEGNSYDDNGVTKNGPGLRIKEIKNNPNMGVISKKNFKYGTNENGRGHIAESLKAGKNLVHEYGMMLWWDYAASSDPNSGRPIFAGTEQCGYRIRDYSSDPMFDYSIFGTFLTYGEVTVYEGSEMENLHKSTYEYSLPNLQTSEFIHGYDVEFSIETPKIYVDPTNLWEGGKLISKTDFRKNIYTRHFEKVVKETFSYERVDKDFAWDMPTYRHITTLLDRSIGHDLQQMYQVWYDKEKDYNTHHAHIFGYGFRKYTSGQEHLSQSIKETFSVDSIITVTTNYTYDPKHLFLKTVATFNSDGRNKTLEYTYPFDSLLITNSPYEKMVSLNMLQIPIQRSLRWDKFLLKSERTSYKEWSNNIIEPENQYSSDNASPEELRIMFHSYDDQGHATSVSKSGGPKVAYLYSYKGLYPIIKIENSDYAAVVNVLGAANIMAFRNLNPDKAAIDSFVAPLKVALPNVHITTYAYKPLTGMTSETDAKGMTTFYEYDSFHRLKYIKDQKGNIIKSYGYHNKS